MNKYCRCCKHEVDLHKNNKCEYDKCHCGYLLIDDGREEVRYSQYDNDNSLWKNRKEKFNPEDKKKDRTVKKKVDFE